MTTRIDTYEAEYMVSWCFLSPGFHVALAGETVRDRDLEKLYLSWCLVRASFITVAGAGVHGSWAVTVRSCSISLATLSF